ncbi:MAG: hypothetical protein HYU25_06560 [Candidatus Rokubacteria bacterium]|nr:hypothetical protein [Candidatus Rokubacteria bacterium]
MSAWPARGADAVRRYLKEIGRFPVLTAKQEAEIGRRIEAGQLRDCAGGRDRPPGALRAHAGAHQADRGQGTVQAPPPGPGHAFGRIRQQLSVIERHSFRT